MTADPPPSDERGEDRGRDARTDGRESLHETIDRLDDNEVRELVAAAQGQRGRPVFSGGPLIRALQALDALVLVVVVVLVAAAVIAFGQEQAKTNRLAMGAKALALENRKIADENRQLALGAKRLAQEIQQQRLNNILVGCQTQNAKYHTLVRRIDTTIARQLKDHAPGVRGLTTAQLRQQRAQLIFVLSVANPLQNCAKLEQQAQRTGQVPIQTVAPAKNGG